MLTALTRMQERARSAPRYWLLVAVAVGIFFAADDQTFVVTVLPAMIRGVDLPVDQFYKASWIVNGYILGFIVALPLMGRVADLYGHGRVYLISLGIFMIGSVLVASSTNLWFMVGARGVQAIGGGALIPVAMAIVADTVVPERRALVLGMMAASSEAGALIGPLWGGGLADLIGWRGLFWINVPMCAAVAVPVWLLARDHPRERTPVDYRGAFVLMVALTLFTIALADDPISPRPWQITALLAAGAAALLALFIYQEARTREAMVPLSFFGRLPFSAGQVTNLCIGGALIVALAGVPLYTNVILRGSALDGGLNLMRLTVMVPPGALAGGVLAGVIGYHLTTGLGLGATAVGFAFMSRWGVDPSELALTLPLLLAGFGFGLVIAPVGAAVVNSVRSDQSAVASALLTVMRMAGMLAGMALLTSRGLGRFYARAATIPVDSPEFKELIKSAQVSTFSEVFIAAAIVCAAGILPALALGRLRKRRVSGVWGLT